MKYTRKQLRGMAKTALEARNKDDIRFDTLVQWVAFIFATTKQDTIRRIEELAN